MKFTTFIILAMAIAVLFVAFTPQESEASRKKLRKLKKIAALSILLKPKKLLALPLPIP